MNFDNQKNTYRIWIRRLVMAIVFTLIILLLLLSSWFENSEGSLTKYHLIAAVALVYVAISVINALKVPYFVSYSDKGEMIIMRYYSLSIFNSKKHSIEIPKKQFVKFEIQTFLIGSQHRIILYQHFRNKIAKYPPISFSAVDKEDREMIFHSLSKYSAK